MDEECSLLQIRIAKPAWCIHLTRLCHNFSARCRWGAAGFKLQRQGSICRFNKGA
jgi:hypothetical protein